MQRLRIGILKVWKHWKIMLSSVSVHSTRSASQRVPHHLTWKLMMIISRRHMKDCTSTTRCSKGRKSGKKTCSINNSKKIIHSTLTESQKLRTPSTCIIMEVEIVRQREKPPRWELTGCIKNGGCVRIRSLWKEGNFKLKKIKWRKWLS